MRMKESMGAEVDHGGLGRHRGNASGWQLNCKHGPKMFKRHTKRVSGTHCVPVPCPKPSLDMASL